MKKYINTEKYSFWIECIKYSCNQLNKSEGFIETYIMFWIMKQPFISRNNIRFINYNEYIDKLLKNW